MHSFHSVQKVLKIESPFLIKPLPLSQTIDEKFIVIIPVLNSYLPHWKGNDSPINSLPSFVINALNSKIATLIFDYSNEAGDSLLVDYLTSQLISRGLSEISRVLLLCQNRKLINKDRAGIRVFPFDFFLVQICLELNKTIDDDLVNLLMNSYDQKDKIFLCMNGTPRSHRLHAVSMLEHLGFLSNSLISFPAFNNTKESEIKLDDELKKMASTELAFLIDSAKSISSKFPMKIDNFEETGNALVRKIDFDNYKRSWCSFVNETGVEVGVLRITEKTFKALGIGHPFIIYSHPQSLSLVRELGFKTYNHIISDDYDNILNPIERLLVIGTELTKFSSSISEKSPDVIEYFKEISSFNINWARNNFLNSYWINYFEPIINFMHN